MYVCAHTHVCVCVFVYQGKGEVSKALISGENLIGHPKSQ